MRIKELAELRKIHTEIKEKNSRDNITSIQMNEAMLEGAVNKVIELGR